MELIQAEGKDSRRFLPMPVAVKYDKKAWRGLWSDA